MDDIIAFVAEAESKGMGVSELEGDVYFIIEKTEGYGKLSDQRNEDLQMGNRTAQSEERNPLDFCIVKSAKPNEISWNPP